MGILLGRFSFVWAYGAFGLMGFRAATASSSLLRHILAISSKLSWR